MGNSSDKLVVGDSTISIADGDITKLDTEAIVNAANSSLMGGGGVDGAIHSAGGSAILEECKKIIQKQGELSPGEAVITTGGNLKAKYVIHTVGPVWHDGNEGEPDILRNCYVNSLKLAKENGIKTIAFPVISAGAYGYPPKEASKTALIAIADFLQDEDFFEEVRCILFDQEVYRIYLQTLGDISHFLGGRQIK